nr:Rpn family recombination-promoting nuclease/putative transposase [Coxiella burnetii]
MSFSTDLFTLFGEEEPLAREVLLKPFTLVDVTQMADEKLKMMRWAGIMELVQKHIFARDFISFLKELLPLLKRLEQANAHNYLISTITYLLQADIEDPTEAVKLINEELSSNIGGEIMTLAERLEKKGFEKGLTEGRSLAERLEQKFRNEEKQLLACQMLQAQIDPLLIAKLTGLHLEEVQAGALNNE